MVSEKNSMTPFHKNGHENHSKYFMLERHRRTTQFLAYYKNHTAAKKVIYGRLSKTRPIACSVVPLKVLESLVLNSIGSFTARPSDSYQFAYKA